MLCKIFTQVHRVVLLLDESFCVEDIGPNIKQEQGKVWTKKEIRLRLIEKELTITSILIRGLDERQL